MLPYIDTSSQRSTDRKIWEKTEKEPQRHNSGKTAVFGNKFTGAAWKFQVVHCPPPPHTKRLFFKKKNIRCLHIRFYRLLSFFVFFLSTFFLHKKFFFRGSFIKKTCILYRWLGSVISQRLICGYALLRQLLDYFLQANGALFPKSIVIQCCTQTALGESRGPSYTPYRLYYST